MAAGEAQVDLDAQEVRFGDSVASFDIDPEMKHRLLNGLDDIALTLQQDDAIAAYEAERERSGRSRRRCDARLRDWDADAYDRVSTPLVEMGAAVLDRLELTRRRDGARRRLRLGPRHPAAARPAAARAA